MRVIWLIGFIGWLGLSSFHPLHVSFTNLDYDQEQNVWRLSAKLFSDDLQKVLEQKYGAGIMKGQQKISTAQSTYLIKYFTEHLDIRINGKDFPVSDWKLEKVTTNYEATWVEFSFNFTDPPTEFSIRNTILFDFYTDQKNLLFVSWKNEEKAFQFTKRREFFSFRI
ncbi:MAG: hypothetical protein J7L96_05720 [Bacteroidales bacterium]|nr:hypothetical protein [Bacteroidales bacterium]